MSTKFVAHDGMSLGTWIIYKCRYEDEHYSTWYFSGIGKYPTRTQVVDISVVSVGNPSIHVVGT